MKNRFEHCEGLNTGWTPVWSDSTTIGRRRLTAALHVRRRLSSLGKRRLLGIESSMARGG